jgi:hypothetical protein
MKLPPNVAEFFRKDGSRGGKKSAASLTPEERVARAKKAVAAVSLTSAQRRASALKVVAAREAKRKQKDNNKKRALGHEVE